MDSKKKLASEKKTFRENVINKLKKLDDEYKIKADMDIKSTILSMRQYEKAKAIFIYVSMNDEVDTIKFIKYAIKDGKIILVPKTRGKGIMDAIEIKSFDDLEDGVFGTQEPRNHNKVFDKNMIDLAIIPCVAIDSKGNRLGYGGGYYDRYLIGADFTKVVVCRAKGMIEKVPIEKHDIMLDYYVTEEGLYNIVK